MTWTAMTASSPSVSLSTGLCRRDVQSWRREKRRWFVCVYIMSRGQVRRSREGCVYIMSPGQVRNGYICNIDRRLPGLRRGQLLGSSRCVALFSAILIHISHNMHLCIQRQSADECSGKLCTCFVSQITHQHALFTCMTCSHGSVFVRTSLFGLVLFFEAQNK